MAEPSKRKLSPEDIARAIRQDILAGRLVPGSRIVERDMSTRFGTSRGPVREALRLLSDEKLVSIAAYRGARVAEPTVDEIIEMFEARAAVYALVARLAVRRANNETVAKLCSRIGELIPLIGAAHGNMRVTRTIMRMASEVLTTLSLESRSDYVQQLFQDCMHRTSWHISYFAVSHIHDPLMHETAWRKLANGLATRDAALAGEGASQIAHATEADALRALSDVLPTTGDAHG